ncbi:MAG: hypothetical protein JWQ57_4257, partial [Mucilaginibacter sp.]|nr:hypothetical protein [Mucilaginibacter sp.]
MGKNSASFWRITRSALPIWFSMVLIDKP